MPISLVQYVLKRSIVKDHRLPAPLSKDMCRPPRPHSPTVNPAVADPETSERGGPRNVKYKAPCLTTIFFMTIFTGRGGGAWAPCTHPPSGIRHCPVYDFCSGFQNLPDHLNFIWFVFPSGAAPANLLADTVKQR